MTLSASKATCLVAANFVALVTSGFAFMAVILSGSTGFETAGRSSLGIAVFAAGVGLTLLLLLLAAVRGERPFSGYLSAVTSLVLFFIVSYFLFD